jgi:hypothetical protein
MPEEVQKRVRHVVEVWGTRRRSITAAMRYPKAYPCWRTPDARLRASIGRFSSVVDEARPQTPPIAIRKNTKDDLKERIGVSWRELTIRWRELTMSWG